MSERRTRWIVFGLALLATIGISGILPVLPLLADVFHVSKEQASLIIVAFAGPGLVLVPFAGVMADRKGRKALLIPSLVLFLVGGVGSACAPTFTFLLVARAIQGIGSASFSILYTTIIADTWQGETRARMMGLNGMALGLGTAISPAIGGILGMLGWRWPFLLSLLSLPILVLSLQASLVKADQSMSLALYCKKSWQTLGLPGTKSLLFLIFLAFLVLSGPVIVCFPLLAHQKFAATPLAIGMIIASASLAAGLAASRLSQLYVRFTPRRLLLAGQAGYLGALLLLPVTGELWWLVLPLLLYGLGQGLTVPLVATLLAGQADTAQRASLMGLNALAVRFAQVVGVWFFSLLAQREGAEWAIIAGVGLVIAGVVAVLCLPAFAQQVKGPESEKKLPIESMPN